MSKFLAPVHSWLFNKIKINEGMENYLLNKIENMEEIEKEAIEKFGEYTKDIPLEDQIDTSNIHGWLQGKITSSERRLAFITGKILESGKTDEETGIYFEEYGKSCSTNSGNPDGKDLFKIISDTVLEGMPCDMVLKPIETTDKTLIYEATRDVHSENSAAAGLNPDIFRKMRENFIIGAAEGAGYSTEITGDSTRTFRLRKNS